MMDCKECEYIKEYIKGEVMFAVDKALKKNINKPKDPVIYVPEGIEFIPLGDGLGLIFGNKGQVLGMYSKNVPWSVTTWRVHPTDKIKTKLTPIDRKDLKPGDWAYHCFYTDIKVDTPYLFALCVGDDKFIHINNGEIKKCVVDNHHWWKVEKV